MAYEGLPVDVRRAVDDRDGHRCRWCGVTNRGRDVHHITYRKGLADDVLENLVSLCRLHHGFVHGTPLPGGQRIVKSVAQHILREVIVTPGATGSSLWRSFKRQAALAGLCEHGEKQAHCPYCVTP